MDPKQFQGLVLGILALIIFNLILVNYRVFFTKAPPAVPLPQSIPLPTLGSPKLLSSPTPPESASTTSAQCSPVCLQKISDESKRLETLMSQKIVALPTAPIASGSTIKEVYIPLGAGSTTSSAWQDQMGTETAINPGDYGVVKEVYFEASLYIPTKNGAVQARLYDTTDGTAITGSDLSTITDTPTKLTSSKLSLPAGSKTYRVQMLSTLLYQARMDFARLRLLIQ